MTKSTVPPPLNREEQADRQDDGYKIIKSYLMERSSVFRDLQEVQKMVWDSPEADEKFAKRQQSADAPTPAVKRFFYSMMLRIGDELQATKHIIPQPEETERLEVLDICMAPGGYSATVLKFGEHAKIYGLSLPEDEGGHEILLPNWQNDPRVQVQLLDVTMLDAALGYPDLLCSAHPCASQFSSFRPYDGQEFDLIFCDGQVLRTHDRAAGSKFEATRLTTAQLILALQKIRHGGTIVMLLHAINKPRNVKLLQGFSEFAEIDVFKPGRSHADRSSFYLVAKNLNPKHPRACQMLQEFKETWKMNTLKAFSPDEVSEDSVGCGLPTGEMEDILQSFGERLISLGEPLWKLQMSTLKKKYLKPSRRW